MDKDKLVKDGLLSCPKYVPYWFYYDKQGLKLFNKFLTEKGHHYMNQSETELLQDHSQEIAASTLDPTTLIEMGSGNCVKSRIIIDALLKRQSMLHFIPVDISEEFLLKTAAKISDEYGNKIDVQPLAVEYGEGIEHLRTVTGNKLIIWLGGGFQNQPYKVQVERIKRLSHLMSDNDRLVVTLDVTQSADRIKLAYSDDTGVQKEFYKNSFWRLNRDYGSKIDTDKLDIDVDYIEKKESNFCSYVTVMAKATEEMEHYIPGLDITLSLKKGESIRLHDGEEYSCKYTIEQIQTLVQAGKQVLEKYWVDQREHIAICCIRKNR